MSFRDFLDADRRLAVLRLLIEAEGSANESIIEKGLDQLGHRAGLHRGYVRELLGFLEAAGCVKLEYFRDKVVVASITERGVAVARGRITVDGIEKPALGS